MRPWLLGCHLYNLPGLSFVQQLLWKGFLHHRTQDATMHALTNLLRQLSSCLGARAGSGGVSTFQAGMKDMVSGAQSSAHGAVFSIYFSVVAPLYNIVGGRKFRAATVFHSSIQADSS